MEQEKPMPLPLSGDEVRNAILYKLNQSMERTCHLKNDNAYTSFRAEVTVKLVLSDYGREVRDNHIISESGSTELEGEPERSVESAMVINDEPPNKVRVETEQDVPTAVMEGDRKVIKKLKYAPRKKVANNA